MALSTSGHILLLPTTAFKMYWLSKFNTAWYKSQCKVVCLIELWKSNTVLAIVLHICGWLNRKLRLFKGVLSKSILNDCYCGTWGALWPSYQCLAIKKFHWSKCSYYTHGVSAKIPFSPRQFRFNSNQVKWRKFFYFFYNKLGQILLIV